MNAMTRPTPAPIVRDLSAGARRVTPFPPDIAVPDAVRPGDTMHTYYNAEGAIEGLVQRCDREDKDAPKGRLKKFLPITTWYEPGRGYVLAHKGMGEGRPLYRLPDLLARPEASVLLVEGEKCADAAAETFGNCVAVTWCGGAQAISKTDFSPLAGRKVLILPDNDEAGQAAAETLVALLQDVGAAKIRVLDIARLGAEISGGAEPGYDIADAISNGLKPNRLRELIQAHPDLVVDRSPAAPPRADMIAEYCKRVWDMKPDLPDGFALDKNGITRIVENHRGKLERQWVGSPIVLVGRTRSSGAGWGYLLAILTPDGTWVIANIPAAALASDGREFREILLRLGATCPVDRACRQSLAEYVNHTRTLPIVDVSHQPGWYEGSFLLPGGVVSPPEAEGRVILDLDGRDHLIGSAGKADDWRRLAGLAEGNARLIIGLCAAFAAPLLRVLNEEGFIAHIYGPSSRGKTTLLLLAGSVWGGGGELGFGHAWRATDNGVEGLAADHNDLLLVLDELGQMEADRLADVIYMLSNGVGKTRSSKTGRALPAARWCNITLSSGEVMIGAHQRSGRQGARGRVTGGMAVRAVDIPVETGPSQSFEALHGFASEAAFSGHIGTLARRSYGHAGPAFVARLLMELDRYRAEAEELIERFVEEITHEGDDAQLRRIARHFAILAAAGTLAIKLDVLPLPEGAALEAARDCYAAWRSARGSSASEDERDALSILRGFFEMHGPSRFQALGEVAETEDFVPKEPDGRPVSQRCGYRATICDDSDLAPTVYYVLPEAWRSEICAGRDATFVAHVARKHGALITGSEARLTRKKRLPDFPNGTWVYEIRPDRLP